MRREKFEEIKKLQPQHPAGDIYLATVIWLEHLNKSRRLQTSLYRDESNFYAGADKAKEENEGDEVDAQGARPLPTINLAYVSNALWAGAFGSFDVNEGTESVWNQDTLIEINFKGFKGLEANNQRAAAQALALTHAAVSYTHLRAHETVLDLVCRLLLENKKVLNGHRALALHIIRYYNVTHLDKYTD